MERERQTVECSPGPSGFCGCASKWPAWWTHCFSSTQAFWLADSAYLSTDLLWSVSHSWYFTVFMRKICSKMPSPAWVQQRTGRHPKKGRRPFYIVNQLPEPTVLPLSSGSLSFPDSSSLFLFEITMFSESETAFLMFSPLVSEMRSPEKWDTQVFTPSCLWI